MLAALGCERDVRHRAQLVDPDAPVRVVFETSAAEAAVTVELADTKPVVDRGLAGRAELGAERGMLFVMTEDRDWSFWMRNTLIPLDIVFITSDLRVAGIVRDAAPKTDTSRKVGVPSLYVLEVNAGWTAQHHVEPGQSVRLENIQR